MGQKNLALNFVPEPVATALVSPLLPERLFFLSTYVSSAHTRYPQPVFLSLLGFVKNYGTARMTAQHSLHGGNAKQGR
jgi:hypothetical protein